MDSFSAAQFKRGRRSFSRTGREPGSTPELCGPAPFQRAPRSEVCLDSRYSTQERRDRLHRATFAIRIRVTLFQRLPSIQRLPRWWTAIPLPTCSQERTRRPRTTTVASETTPQRRTSSTAGSTVISARVTEYLDDIPTSG